MSIDTYDHLRGLIAKAGCDADVDAFDNLLKHHEGIGRRSSKTQIKKILEDKLKVIEEHANTDGEIVTDKSDGELLKALIQGLTT